MVSRCRLTLEAQPGRSFSRLSWPHLNLAMALVAAFQCLEAPFASSQRGESAVCSVSTCFDQAHGCLRPEFAATMA